MFEKNINPSIEFEQSLVLHREQVFIKKEESINAILNENNTNKSLTKDEAWQGLKWKAEMPHFYIPVQETAILPGRMKTAYGEVFLRLTIQPSFVTKKQVIVKEEVHILENEKRILFLGRHVNKEEAKLFLNNFKAEMLAENPALFNVEHGLKGTTDHPIATWKMVRRSQVSVKVAEEADKVAAIREIVMNSKGTKIYLQTIKQLDDEKNVKDSKI